MNESAAAGPAPAASVVLAQDAGWWSRLVDHSWLLLDGVLFCVAGSLHTATEVTGCAYWINAPLAEHLQGRLPALRGQPRPGPAPMLRYAGATYVKLAALAPPQVWPEVHAALAGAGIRPVEASLLATAQLTAAAGMLDPRDALRAAAALPAHPHRCGLGTLHTLLTAIGDPAGDSGVLGLTGSAAFDPRRLCGDGAAETDIDLLIYDRPRPVPSARSPLPAEVLVHASISELGGVRLADLPAADRRLAAYGGSRLFPAGRAGPGRDRLWGRRRDVAWIGEVRLDMTVVPTAADLVDELPYAAPPERAVAGFAQLDSVAPGYPARLTAHVGGRPADIWVTARGFDGALQPDDRVRLSGAARRTGRGLVVTVDDIPSHHLQLEA